MADLSVVSLFCLLYSGVVVSSLWLTVSRRPQEARLKKSA